MPRASRAAPRRRAVRRAAAGVCAGGGSRGAQRRRSSSSTASLSAPGAQFPAAGSRSTPSRPARPRRTRIVAAIPNVLGHQRSAPHQATETQQQHAGLRRRRRSPERPSRPRYRSEAPREPLEPTRPRRRRAKRPEEASSRPSRTCASSARRAAGPRQHAAAVPNAPSRVAVRARRGKAGARGDDGCPRRWRNYSLRRVTASTRGGRGGSLATPA